MVAGEPSDIGYITKEQFENILGGNVSSVAERNDILKALGQIALFKTLSASKLKAMAGALKVREFDEREKIITEGERSSDFYIVKEGTVDIVKGENEHIIRTLSKLMCFGERAVLLDEKRSASAVATSPNTQCWVMSSAAFRHVMDENIIAHLAKRMEL